MKFSIEVDKRSLAGVQRRTRRRLEKQRKEAQRFVEDEAKRLLQEAQDLAPVLTGELRDSGEVSKEKDGAEVRFTAPHARDVHEDLTAFRSNGEAKFLEKPLRKRETSFARDLAREVKI